MGLEMELKLSGLEANAPGDLPGRLPPRCLADYESRVVLNMDTLRGCEGGSEEARTSFLSGHSGCCLGIDCGHREQH